MGNWKIENVGGLSPMSQDTGLSPSESCANCAWLARI